ncbi:hypothetical protein KEM60_02741 [Austwickia sp. TVS 96-490-7B]|uniref:hypothetical protein n=1 Tax=Austwickia sp. TVS 96-490-7B TaxID=2830843 RepID=UPI001C574157|nr:hypothetical protein [Austwickia sp. TVS 96-490-7B]MBW3086520.1 hypothetical protein [Austwickia sp. TVS 96-490-7B]
MKRTITSIAWGMALALGALPGPAATAQPEAVPGPKPAKQSAQYQLTSINTGTLTRCSAADISDSGFVIGNCAEGPFRFYRGRATPLERPADLPASAIPVVNKINRAGEAIGTVTFPDGDPSYYWHEWTMRWGPGKPPQKINDVELWNHWWDVIGVGDDGSVITLEKWTAGMITHRWYDGKWGDRRSSVWTYVRPRGVLEDGSEIGMLDSPGAQPPEGSHFPAAYWWPQNVAEPQQLPSLNSTKPASYSLEVAEHATRDGSWIVGRSVGTMVRWNSARQVEAIPGATFDDFLIGVDGGGRVVGGSAIPGSERYGYFLWADGGRTQLDDIVAGIPQGWRISGIAGINSRGDIAATIATGSTEKPVLRPVVLHRI